MAALLLIAHAPTPLTQDLRDALAGGAGDELVEGVEVRVAPPLEVTADDINAADAVLVLSTANFGYMAGLVKDLFDRTFLQIGGALANDGRAGESPQRRVPFGLCVHGRYDTEGATRSILALTTAVGWVQCAPVLELLGDLTEDDRAAAHELGATLAALIA